MTRCSVDLAEYVAGAPVAAADMSLVGLGLMQRSSPSDDLRGSPVARTWTSFFDDVQQVFVRNDIRIDVLWIDRSSLRAVEVPRPFEKVAISRSSSSADDEDSSEANIASARQLILLDVDNPPGKPPHFPFLAIPGKTFNLSSPDDLMEYIQQFLNDELISLVVDETNR
ncbi:hypothetical protein HPB49_006127 [Dermacentor silvarum]|uniref:Uncharacterized protein n=1 Tax=Dermacentor silvarum TaxID=543639 RepID=A0ACB8CDG8_DERSI|nr:hypothetical protein HPB49_006127 [Dermacentor silvarum]